MSTTHRLFLITVGLYLGALIWSNPAHCTEPQGCPTGLGNEMCNYSGDYPVNTAAPVFAAPMPYYGNSIPAYVATIAQARKRGDITIARADELLGELTARLDRQQEMRATWYGKLRWFWKFTDFRIGLAVLVGMALLLWVILAIGGDYADARDDAEHLLTTTHSSGCSYCGANPGDGDRCECCGAPTDLKGTQNA